jgi:hypothetical protein
MIFAHRGQTPKLIALVLELDSGNDGYHKRNIAYIAETYEMIGTNPKLALDIYAYKYQLRYDAHTVARKTNVSVSTVKRLLREMHIILIRQP